MPEMDPYAATRAFAMELEAKGVDPELIIDAMLYIGLNACDRLHGPEFVVTRLRMMVDVYEGQAASPLTH